MNYLKRLFATPTRKQELLKQLHAAELDLAEHQRLGEYHQAMCIMLTQRIGRIKKEIGNEQAA